MSAIFEDQSQPTPTSSYDDNNYWANNVYSSQTLSTFEGAGLKEKEKEKDLGRTRSGRLGKDVEDRKRLSESLSFHEYSESTPAHALMSLSSAPYFAPAPPVEDTDDSTPYRGPRPPSPESQPSSSSRQHSRTDTNQSATSGPLVVQSPTVPTHAPAPTYQHQIFANVGSLGGGGSNFVAPFVPGSTAGGRTTSEVRVSYQNPQVALRPPPASDQPITPDFKPYDTNENGTWSAEADAAAALMARGRSGDTEVDEEEQVSRGLLTITTPSPEMRSAALPGASGKGKKKAVAGVAPTDVTSPQNKRQRRNTNRTHSATSWYDDEDQDHGEGTSSLAVADASDEEMYMDEHEDKRRRSSTSLSRSDRADSHGPRDPHTGKRIFNGLSTTAAKKVAMDAPIQARSYAGESKTSRKDIPVAMKRVLKKVAKRRGGEVGEQEEVERIVKEAREANTKSARLSRQRKKEFLDNLIKENEELKAQLEAWRSRAEKAERELGR